MTVTYTSDVTTSRNFSNFLRLLMRWRGSIYKLVWADLLTFLFLYIIVMISYRLILSTSMQTIFESLVGYCGKQIHIIPLSFVLGFYVDLVMKRWWQQYITIPWPDSIAILISAHIQGYDDRARVMRRTIMRYVCLCQVIVFTLISPRVKKRFPTYDQIIEAGLLLENEKAIIEPLDKAFPNYPKHWMPIVWAASIVMRARHENKIRDDYAVKSIIDELNSFRGLCGFLLYYDWVTIPLVYTQVVTLATYAYFLSALFARQWVNSSETDEYNLFYQYCPLVSILQFFFYMGWLKVAESLINPFGDDDDDFEVNWMIDRNLTISYLIVDEMHQEHPELIKDQYWDEVFPNEMPYTNLTTRNNPPEASTNKLMNMKSLYIKSQFSKIIDSRKFSKPLLSRMHSSTSELERHSAFKLLASRTELERNSGYNLTPTDSTALLLLGEPPASKSMNFEDLMAQRDRERRERLRDRYIHMHNHSRCAGYTITILRAPSPKVSIHLQSNLETVEEVQEPAVEEEQESEQNNIEQEPLLKDKQAKK